MPQPTSQQYQQLILQLIDEHNPYPRGSVKYHLYIEGLLIGYLSKAFRENPTDYVPFKQHNQYLKRRAK